MSHNRSMTFLNVQLLLLFIVWLTAAIAAHMTLLQMAQTPTISVNETVQPAPPAGPNLFETNGR